jgi:hypothetical protein
MTTILNKPEDFPKQVPTETEPQECVQSAQSVSEININVNKFAQPDSFETIVRHEELKMESHTPNPLVKSPQETPNIEESKKKSILKSSSGKEVKIPNKITDHGIPGCRERCAK